MLFVDAIIYVGFLFLFVCLLVFGSDLVLLMLLLFCSFLFNFFYLVLFYCVFFQENT